MNAFKLFAHQFGRKYIAKLCRSEFENQKSKRRNERPVEFAFVFRKLSETYPQTVLDVGTGTTALPHLIRNCGFHVTATDNVTDYWPDKMVNRHFHIVDDDITNTKLESKFDFVTCVSVLEHIVDSESAVRSMISLLNPGGHLILTFPYSETEYVSNVYDLPGSTYGQQANYVTQAYSRNEIDKWVAAGNAKIVEQEYWRFWDGEFWTVGDQVLPPQPAQAESAHQLTCLHLQRT